mgnify:CR=1 FL=1
MKRLIYKTKRFFHSLKVRWKLRKSFKIWRDASSHSQMAAYDIAQRIKVTNEEIQKALRRATEERGRS